MSEEEPVRIRRYSPKRVDDRLGNIISRTGVGNDVSKLIEGYEEKQPFKNIAALTYNVDGRIKETIILKDDRVAIKYNKDNKTYITIRNVMDEEICLIKSIPFSSRHLSTMVVTGLGHLALLIDRTFAREIQIYNTGSGKLIQSLTWIPKHGDQIKIYFMYEYAIIIDSDKVKYWNYIKDEMDTLKFSTQLGGYKILPLNNIYYLLYNLDEIIIINLLARRSTKLDISEKRNIGDIHLVNENSIIYTLNNPPEIVYYDVNNDKEIFRALCYNGVEKDEESKKDGHIINVLTKNNLCAVLVSNFPKYVLNFYNLDDIKLNINSLIIGGDDHRIIPIGFISDDFIFVKKYSNYTKNSDLYIYNIFSGENSYDGEIDRKSNIKGILENDMLLILKENKQLELLF